MKRRGDKGDGPDRSGFRMTRQRRVILEELDKAASHPTADELYARVRRRLPRISLGTVYRNLELLSARGLIGKLDSSGSQRRWDARSAPHYHVRCRSCGRIGDVEIEPIRRMHSRAARASGYKVDAHRLEFVGLCPQCRDDRPAAGERPAKGRRK